MLSSTSKSMNFNSISCIAIISFGLAILLLATPTIAKDESVTVVLKYDWPADLAGNMKMVRNETIINDDGEEVSNETWTARVNTELHSNGLLVSISDVVYEASDSSNDQSSIESELDMKLNVKLFENSWLVAPGGELIEVMGIRERIADIRRAIVKPFTDPDVDIPNSTKQPYIGLVDTILSDERMVETLSGNWNQNVQQWDGMTLQIGKPQKIEHETPSIVPGEALISIGTYELIKRLPCHDGESENRCVELKFSSELTEESQAKHDEFMSNMYKSMFKDFEEDLDVTMDMPDIKSEQNVILITDPNTLIPFSVIEEKTTTTDLGSGRAVRQTISNFTKLYEYQ